MLPILRESLGSTTRNILIVGKPLIGAKQAFIWLPRKLSSRRWIEADSLTIKELAFSGGSPLDILYKTRYTYCHGKRSKQLTKERAQEYEENHQRLFHFFPHFVGVSDVPNVFVLRKRNLWKSFSPSSGITTESRFGCIPILDKIVGFIGQIGSKSELAWIIGGFFRIRVTNFPHHNSPQ